MYYQPADEPEALYQWDSRLIARARTPHDHTPGQGNIRGPQGALTKKWRVSAPGVGFGSILGSDLQKDGDEAQARPQPCYCEESAMFACWCWRQAAAQSSARSAPFLGRRSSRRPRPCPPSTRRRFFGRNQCHRFCRQCDRSLFISLWQADPGPKLSAGQAADLCAARPRWRNRAGPGDSWCVDPTTGPGDTRGVDSTTGPGFAWRRTHPATAPQPAGYPHPATAPQAAGYPHPATAGRPSRGLPRWEA